LKIPGGVTPRTQRETQGKNFLRNVSSAGTASQSALGNQLVQFGNTLGTVGGLLTEQAKAARKFGTLASYADFQTSVNERMEALKRDANPALGNFAEIAQAEYNNWESDWLDTVPYEFYEEFKARSLDTKTAIARESLAFQYERTDEYFRQGMQDNLNTALVNLDQDGSIANLEAVRLQLDEQLANTALTEAEKLAIQRKMYSAIESIAYKTEVRRGNLDVGALGVGSAPGRAVDLLMEFDGASLDNGLTYDENQQLLGERVKEAERIASAAAGSIDRWAAMPERARAVLISLADDLGEIPTSVKQAIESGDLEAVAAAVAGLSATEGDRRDTEAGIILGQTDMPEGQLDADPRFANVPYEDRLALRADAEREAAAQQAAETAAAKAAQEASINSLMLDLHDGNAGQFEIDQARESGTLSDYNDVKRAQDLLDKRDGDLRAVQNIQSMVNNGIVGNPADEDFRNAFNTYVGEAGKQALLDKNPDYVQQVLVPAVRQLGDLPTDTVGQLTAMTRSQDPAQALFALDTLSQLQQASPEAYNARVTEEMRRDVAYWQGVKDYYPEDEVLSSVRGGTTQEERVRNEALSAEAEKLVSEGKVKFDAGQLGVGTGGFFGFGNAGISTPARVAMGADWQQIFELEYQRDGDQNAAMKRTYDAMKTIWSTTEVGGQKSVMKYPPELAGYKPWNGSMQWVTDQGRAELGIEGNFTLISDEQTKQELTDFQAGSNVRPSYIVSHLDDNGEIVFPTDENGQVQRMFFEVTPEMEAEKAAGFAQEQRRTEYEAFQRVYDDARRHSLQTGVPIPDELTEEMDQWLEEFPGPRNSMSVFGNWGAN